VFLVSVEKLPWIERDASPDTEIPGLLLNDACN
jgi:hypothetical protein